MVVFFFNAGNWLFVHEEIEQRKPSVRVRKL